MQRNKVLDAVRAWPAEWWIGAIALLGWVTTLCLRPLLLPDEGRYVSVAWEMLRSGDWLVPRLNGLPFFHKPPLFYWLTALAMGVGGVHEWMARAASAAAAGLAVVAMVRLTLLWCGPQLAKCVAFVMLLQPLWLLGAQFANLDMLVAALISVTVVLLAHAALLHMHGERYRAVLLLAYACAGLGVLAKGLIGVVLPALVIGLWLLSMRRWRTVLALLSPWGVLLFVAVAAPWFLLLQAQYGDFLHYFFVVQHFQRFASGGFNNVEPGWFYPLVLAVMGLPGVLWLRPWQWWLRNRLFDDRSALRWLMVLALVCVTLFFSLPQSKPVGYILPAVPALAWLVADAYESRPPTRAGRRYWLASLVTSGLMGVAVAGCLTLDKARNARDLGLALLQVHQSGEPVFMLNDILFDVPVYAQLHAPVYIGDDWQNPQYLQHDNWRRELLDASHFDPQQAEHILVRPPDLLEEIKASPVSWVVARTSLLRRYPFLRNAELVYSAHGRGVWRIQRRPPQVPSHALAKGQ